MSPEGRWRRSCTGQWGNGPAQFRQSRDCRSSRWVTRPSTRNARPLPSATKRRSKASSYGPRPRGKSHFRERRFANTTIPLPTVRRLPASLRCRQTQQQQAADDDADHHDRAEGTPRVVVFAVLNEERNHEYDPTDRSAIRSSLSGRFPDEDESVFEDDVDRLATAGVTRGCNPPVNDQ